MTISLMPSGNRKAPLIMRETVETLEETIRKKYLKIALAVIAKPYFQAPVYGPRFKALLTRIIEEEATFLDGWKGEVTPEIRAELNQLFIKFDFHPEKKQITQEFSDARRYFFEVESLRNFSKM